MWARTLCQALFTLWLRPFLNSLSLNIPVGEMGALLVLTQKLCPERTHPRLVPLRVLIPLVQQICAKTLVLPLAGRCCSLPQWQKVAAPTKQDSQGDLGVDGAWRQWALWSLHTQSPSPHPLQAPVRLS